jgi:hypothetical protein
MKVPEDLSKETLEKICQQHVRRFESLLAQAKDGNPNVREDECTVYLATWLGGQTALQLGNPLPDDCVSELKDALYSGEADELLTGPELEKLEAYLASGA